MRIPPERTLADLVHGAGLASVVLSDVGPNLSVVAATATEGLVTPRAWPIACSRQAFASAWISRMPRPAGQTIREYAPRGRAAEDYHSLLDALS